MFGGIKVIMCVGTSCFLYELCLVEYLERIKYQGPGFVLLVGYYPTVKKMLDIRYIIHSRTRKHG